MNNKEIDTAFELHQSIRFGDITEARSLIANFSQEERRRFTREYPEYGIQSALFVAIERNNREFVEFLLNECYADIEEKLWNENPIGLVSPSPISPLEFAYFTEKYTICELLLIYGGDPTRLLNDRKAIVRICRYELLSLRSLQILAYHGAAFNTSDDDGFTCLMQTVRRPDLSQFLLKTGVDVNFKNKDGDTALHLAVKCQCSDTVRLILGYGADPCCKNEIGCDPLHFACFFCFDEIVDILLNAVEDKGRHVETYQLLGICSDDATKAMSAWRKAITVSSTIPNQASPATLNTPFGIAVEATSFAELDALDQNRELFLMQAVVLAYKIFGPNHEAFFNSIELSAKSFFQLDLYDQTLQMLTFCLQKIHDASLNQAERCSQLERFFTNLDTAMKNSINMNAALNVSSALEFTEVVVGVLRDCTGFTAKELLLDLISQFFSINFEHGPELERLRLVRSVIELIGEYSERTVLTDLVCRWLRDGVSIPRLLPGVDVLLQCGADVDERDPEDNNTVVHFLFECGALKLVNIVRLRMIAAKFVEHGVHLDSRNRAGMTTAECLQVLGITVKPPIDLMCLAARVIRQHKIRVQGILPKILIDFVEMH